MKKYRFFYHYYKRNNEMSVHFKGKCYRAKHVDCEVPSETKWNTHQPQLTLRGWATSIDVIGDKIIIK